jgi:hypothetical protein
MFIFRQISKKYCQKSIVLLFSKFVDGTAQIELKMGLKKVNN